MVNLLIGIAIGLSVLSAATFWVNFQWQQSRQILQRSHAQQESSALMDTLIHDLRQANFQGVKLTGMGLQDPLCSSQFCGALEDFDVTGQQILFSMDRNENGIKENNECSGFRFNANQIQMKTLCKEGQWTGLTKPQNLEVVAFKVKLLCSSDLLNQDVILSIEVRSQMASEKVAITSRRSVRLRNVSSRSRNVTPYCRNTDA
jgi:type IV pilus assembly protein PilW